MMKQFDHMIERKLNPRLKFLAGCGQFSDFSNKRSCFNNLDDFLISSLSTATFLARRFTIFLTKKLQQ